MGLGKDKLIYDSTTPADGDSVAAFLRTGTEALTSTSGALNVNISAFTAADVDIRNLVFATDKVDTSGSVIALDATSLAALENITVSGNMTATGNVADDAADSGNPVKVGTRAVSGALIAVSTTGDRADAISDLYRRQFVNTTPNVGGSNAAVAVDTTVGGVALFASPIAGRRKADIQNLGNKAIFVGFGTVTSVNGTRIAAGATYTTDIGPDLALKAISESGTQDVRVLQLA